MPREPLTLERCADMVNHPGADIPHIEDSIRSAVEVLKEREESHEKLLSELDRVSYDNDTLRALGNVEREQAVRDGFAMAFIAARGDDVFSSGARAHILEAVDVMMELRADSIAASGREEAGEITERFDRLVSAHTELRGKFETAEQTMGDLVKAARSQGCRCGVCVALAGVVDDETDQEQG